LAPVTEYRSGFCRFQFGFNARIPARCAGVFVFSCPKNSIDLTLNTTCARLSPYFARLEFKMTLILITGASSGIGAATARNLANKGATLILVARSKDTLETVAKDIGPNAISIPCDASNPQQVREMAQRVLSNHGVPDAIINSAGAGQWKAIPDTDPSEAMQMMQAPYFAAFNVTHAFLPEMLKRNSGVIINLNSPACYFPWPSSVGYSAARGALRSFSEALSQDLVGTGVKSCHVIFSAVASPYFDNNPGIMDKMPAMAKMLPILSPERCAAVLAKSLIRPRHTIFHPFTLRVLVTFGNIFPPIARWLMRL
jgi:short-subunit dehydrogenase